MSGQIVLFDITSKQGTCWSLNPWKSESTPVNTTTDPI
jgi:hypothetical protein